MQNGQPAPASATGATETPVLPHMGQEYADILRDHNLEFVALEHYLQVGNPPQQRGWILHLSVISTQFQKLLEACLPLLLSSETAFRIAKNEYTIHDLSGGKHGKAHIGKIITIYPENNKKALILAEALIATTQGYKGPFIYTDIHLGGVVYTRYAGIYPKLLEDTRPPQQQLTATILGQKIPDLLFDPYYLPAGVEWPFSSIKAHQAPQKEALLHNKYSIQKVLKSDLKGSVYRASYFTGFTNELCVIKAGNRFVSVDKEERDTTDRLKWQFYLHNTLHKIVPLPRVYELFEQEHTSYLVMEFVKGVPLYNWVIEQRKNLHWQDIPARKKKQLIRMMIRVIEIIEDMHRAGFLHRDITGPNFLVDERNNVTMIDLELSFPCESIGGQTPFGLGSPGFMSPEQEAILTPTIAQDVYAVGALMIHFFTGLKPQKISTTDSSFQEKQLYFLTGNQAVTNLIMSCVHTDPDQRPELIRVKEALYLLMEEHETGPALFSSVHLSDENIQVPEGQFEWERFLQGLFRDFAAHLPGLADGKVGMALCTVGALRNGKLTDDPEIREFIAECFKEDSEELHMMTGIAGQGLAMLECSKWIDDIDFRRGKLDGYVTKLVNRQLENGSWPLPTSSGGNPSIGLWDGIAGIIDFLIEYQRRRTQVDCKANILKALQWIAQQQKGDSYMEGWHKTNIPGANAITSFAKGSIGIAYLYIKAYLLFNDPLYKELCTQLLNQVPEHILMDKFDLPEGLTGLGEVYLTAWLAFEDKTWQERTDWIVTLLQHTVLTQTEPHPLFWRGQSFPELAIARPKDYESAFLYNYLDTRKYTDQPAT